MKCVWLTILLIAVDGAGLVVASDFATVNDLLVCKEGFALMILVWIVMFVCVRCFSHTPWRKAANIIDFSLQVQW